MCLLGGGGGHEREKESERESIFLNGLVYTCLSLNCCPITSVPLQKKKREKQLGQLTCHCAFQMCLSECTAPMELTEQVTLCVGEGIVFVAFVVVVAYIFIVLINQFMLECTFVGYVY